MTGDDAVLVNEERGWIFAGRWRGSTPFTLFLVVVTFGLLPIWLPGLAAQESGTGGSSGLRVSYGLDLFTRQQTEISGLNALVLVYETERGFYLGNSVYSAATGTGGGLFVGGIEAGLRLPLGSSLDLRLGGFVGGGGGATQVSGDGLMTRAHATLGARVSERFSLSPSVARIRVTGSPISTTAFGLSLSHAFDGGLRPGHGDGADATSPSEPFRRVATFKPTYRSYIPFGSQVRGSGDRELEALHTMGAELSFARSPDSEVFIQTYGVFAGDAEGYADWLLGYRRFLNLEPIRLSLSVGTGSAGGGAVNSGGGQVILAGGGIQWAATSNGGIEVEAMTVQSLNGDFRTFAPGVRLIRYLAPPFASADGPRRYDWRLRSGVVSHLTNTTYRKNPSHPNDAVHMIELGLDLFFSPRFYLTGQAYTSFVGDAGGYQIGLLGPGLTLPLGSSPLSLSTEAYLGAGGGAGVDTQGGLLAGGRAELEWELGPALRLRGGAGTLAAVQGRGMNPLTLHAGFSVPFRSSH